MIVRLLLLLPALATAAPVKTVAPVSPAALSAPLAASGRGVLTELMGLSGRARAVVQYQDKQRIIVADPATLVETNFFGRPENTRRDVYAYAQELGKRLAADLDTAGPDAHILDLGAGEMVAARQIAGILHTPMIKPPLANLYTRSPREMPRVTAVSYTVEDPKIAATPNFNPLMGRYFEDIPDEELLRFGPITTGMDLYGVFSYTTTPDRVLAKLHRIMDERSKFYLFTANLGVEHILTRHDEFLSMLTWLKELPGFQTEFDPYRHVMTLRKDPDVPLYVPKVELTPDQPKSTALPPLREFREVP